MNLVETIQDSLSRRIKRLKKAKSPSNDAAIDSLKLKLELSKKKNIKMKGEYVKDVSKDNSLAILMRRHGPAGRQTMNAILTGALVEACEEHNCSCEDHDA